MHRNQITAEQVEAILEILETNGAVTSEWRQAVEQISDPGQGREVAERKRNGKSPPEWSNGGDY